MSTAFVIMPFDEEYNSFYEHVLKPCLTDAGYAVSRADEVLGQQNILKAITLSIQTSDLVVADLSLHNPNVYYELGLAHGLRRPVLLITRSIDALPFDLRSYRVIPYDVHFLRIPDFRKRMSEALDGIKSGAVALTSPVSDFLDRGVSGDSRPSDVVDRQIETLESGLFDHIATVEEEVPVATNIVASVNERVAKLGESMQRFGQLMATSSTSSVSERRRLIHLASAQIRDWALAVDQATIQFGAIWSRVEIALTGWLENPHWQEILKRAEERRRAAELLAGLRQLSEDGPASVAAVRKFAADIRSLRGFEATLTRACDSASRAAGAWADQLDGAISSLTGFAQRLGDQLSEATT